MTAQPWAEQMADKIIEEYTSTNWDTDMGSSSWLEVQIARALQAAHAKGLEDAREVVLRSHPQSRLVDIAAAIRQLGGSS